MRISAVLRNCRLTSSTSGGRSSIRIVEGANKVEVHPFDDCVTIRPASASAFRDLCDRGWTPPSTLRWIACSIPIRACDQTSLSTRLADSLVGEFRGRDRDTEGPKQGG